MEKDDLIAKAVKIVKSNSKSLRIVLSARGQYQIVTDQGSFFIDNRDGYSIDELREIFERKKYSGIRISLLDFTDSSMRFQNISDIPEATTSSETPDSAKVFFYNFNSNKGKFFIKEDSDSPYSIDAFKALIGRSMRDVDIISLDVSDSPITEEAKYQSLSQFISNPKFDRSGGDFDDSDKTFYYKVETSNGLFLLKDISKEVLEQSDIKLIIKRNFRDVLIISLKRSMNTPHTGYTESDYQTFAEFNRNPRDINSSPSETENAVDIITNQIATMDPPPNAISALFNRDIAPLPVDMQKQIIAHRANYSRLHIYFRDMLRRFKITPTSSVSSLPEDKRDAGEILINLYDDIQNGTVTQKEFIKRMEQVLALDMKNTRENVDFINDLFSRKSK